MERPSRQFTGKTALVTGGGTGIGRAAALALAADGCRVTVAGRTAATLEATVRDIEAAGGSARQVICDVTSEADVSAAELLYRLVKAVFARQDTLI